MAGERVRRWGVRPDTSIITQQHGEIACVSREAMVEAIMDGEAMLARQGGILEVVTSRHPTDLPGEAVTTGAVVSWKAGVSATLDERSPAAPAQSPAPAPAAALVEAAPQPQPVAPRRDENLAADLAAAMQADIARAAPAPAPERITGTAPNGAVPDPVPVPAAPRDDIGDGLDHPEAEVDYSEIPADHR